MFRKKKRSRAVITSAPLSKNNLEAERDDVTALRKFLQQSTVDAIARTILDSLKIATPENVQSLKEMLGPLFEDASNPLHCGRCHFQFVKSDNHDEACLVKCHDDPEWVPDGYGDDGGYYEMMCCGKTFTEFDNPGEICFKTRHTTNPKNVRYREDKKEDKKEGLDLSGMNDVISRVNGCKLGRK